MGVQKIGDSAPAAAPRQPSLATDVLQNSRAIDPSNLKILSAKLLFKNSELKILGPSATTNEAAADDDDHHSTYECTRRTTASSGSFDDAPQ